MKQQPIHLDQGGNPLHKLQRLNWLLIALIAVMACIGFMALTSAGSGDFGKWAAPQLIRFLFGLCVMIVIALINVRWWFRGTWIFYGIGLLLLLFVEVKGHVGMGAQRWINLGFMKLQPSEIMKLAVVMALARYYHVIGVESARQLQSLIIPVIIIALPVGLVMFQPDLGTALVIMVAGASVIFMAGAPYWWFGTAIGAGIAFIPIAWHFLHDYQKDRILIFLNPEKDPLGAGYHITQSKIALGSGGFFGKGYMEGSQSRLNFLPEKQTDFIFTLWAEEWGFLGGCFILLTCAMIFLYGIWIALHCRHGYGRYLALGLMVNFSLYIIINIAMVMGLIPVVGVPLPFVSYGGTAMLACLIGFGLMMSCSLHSDGKMSRL